MRSLKAPFFLTVFLVVFCDRVSKIAVSETLAPGFHHEVLPFFDLVHYRNTGIAFGMLQGMGTAARFAVYGGALAAAAFLVPVFLKSGARNIFVAFVLGGAVGNSIDRFVFGYVTDFAEIHWFGSAVFRWPAFNAADFFITAGTAGIVFDLLKRRSACSRA